MAKGSRVIFECGLCKNYIATIEIDEGTTPRMIACKSEGCDGFMEKKVWSEIEGSAHPRWVWVKATEEEMSKMNKWLRGFCLRGGLILKRASGEEVSS